MATLREAADTISPSSIGFSPDGGTGDVLYHLDSVADKGEFVEAIVELIGFNIPREDGIIGRQIPKVHPQFPWLVATAIGTIRGVGHRDKDGGVTAHLEATDAGEIVPAALPNFVLYPNYDISVTFDSVPYQLLPDDQISMLPGIWTDDNGDAFNYDYADEYRRFTDWPIYPAPEFLQFRQGQQKFRVSGGHAANGAAFPGLIRVPVRKNVIKCMWYRVPEHYVTSERSYLDRFIWRVNQNPVTFFNDRTYQPGELLYEGFSFPRRNNPAFPPEDEEPGIYLATKLVDVELTFRVCTFFDPLAPAPVNGNWIANGHNLLIWAGDRRPHYVTSVGVNPASGSEDDTDEAFWTPTYLSCPMELLFTDPDFVQDIGTLR
jgi:hypothetical protein